MNFNIMYMKIQRLHQQKRKNMWRQLEKKYLPHKNYEGDDFLERGGFWFKQGHIFENPILLY